MTARAAALWRALARGWWLVAVILTVLYPLGAFLFHGRIFQHVDKEAVGNSLGIAAAATAAALPVGFLLAWLSECRRWRGRGLTELACWLVFLLPSYLLTLGWQTLIERPQWMHTAVADAFFGIGGIVSLLALKGVPFACFAGRATLRAMGAEWDEVAAVFDVGRVRAAAIAARALLPAAAASAVVVFAESIQEFGIPATLGARIHLHVMPYDIYTRLATTPADFSGAAGLSVQLAAIAVAAATVHIALHLRFGATLIGARHRARHPVCPRRGVAAAGWLSAAATLVLGFVIPIASLMHQAFGSEPQVPVPWSSVASSLVYALLGAGLTLAIVMAMLRGGGASRSIPWVTIAMEGFSLAGMAVPGVVLGAAYVFAFNRGPVVLYGTPLLLVIAYSSAVMPMLVRLLRAPLEQIHVALDEAAVVHVADPGRRLLDIALPLRAGPLLWAGFMAFATMVFELPISELLAPPGRTPLAVSIVNLMQGMNDTAAARLGLAGVAVVGLLGAGLVGLASRRLTGVLQPGVGA